MSTSTSPKTKRTFVSELSTPIKAEKPPGKKFEWSSAIVDPAKNKNQNFMNVTKAAPVPKATGTLSPASETLRDTRRMVAQVRKAKKVRS